MQGHWNDAAPETWSHTTCARQQSPSQVRMLASHPHQGAPHATIVVSHDALGPWLLRWTSATAGPSGPTRHMEHHMRLRWRPIASVVQFRWAQKLSTYRCPTCVA